MIMSMELLQEAEDKTPILCCGHFGNDIDLMVTVYGASDCYIVEMDVGGKVYAFCFETADEIDVFLLELFREYSY